VTDLPRRQLNPVRVENIVGSNALVKFPKVDIGKGPGSWSALPTAEGRWTGAKTAATHEVVQFALAAAISAGLAAWPVLNEVGFYHVSQREHWPVGTWISMYVFAALFAFMALASWRHRKFLLKLDEAANGSCGRGR
jgi:hypothetical protein